MGINMTLNSYKDEAKDFLQKIGALNEGVKSKINWLDDEFKLLKDAVNDNAQNRLKHQIYDMLFLLFEISADYNFDLDKEWDIGKEHKQKKYIDNNYIDNNKGEE